ncbi:MAG: biotin--[acetyl-CoA-carboxylase] ligase [Xanthomonadaceae bacterium]|jgi:BirA family biotin operon repressor/biotin-[acetyl-CoA-carboxylase] ligase|nr:biotin--[acetyl-CoA-carboxylase] ligase [Xanthomonadaceae bacterium]
MRLDDLLAALAHPQGASGSELAARFGVTRAAVWKRIEALRAAGLAVEAVAGRGYRLAAPLDLLDAAAIRAALPADAARRLATLVVDAEVDSTSSALLRDAAAGARSGSARLAERQTAGRGRRGRAWQSPIAANLYLSVLWRFEGGLSALAGLSIAAGVAVAQALQTLGADGVRLKWPNDLVHDDRKLGGILVDAAGEWAGPCHAVVGIGINVRMPAAAAAAIDQPWTDLAQVLGGRDGPLRNPVAAALLAQLLPALATFETGGLAPFRTAFAALDALHGRAVTVHDGAAPWAATAAGLCDDGRLRVTDPKGREHRLAAAEVSVHRAAEAG